MSVPTQVQQDVSSKHNELWEKGETFAQEWKSKRSPSLSSSSHGVCVWTVSSTKSSGILLLSVGLESKFTYNTYSEDEDNPWLIQSGLVTNPILESYIRAYWKDKLGSNDTVHENICPFMVYQIVGNDWQREDLVVHKKCIRVKIKDITIWCHPPRFEVIKRVINEDNKKGFNKEVGKFVQNVKNLEKVDANQKIPDDKKGEAKERCKTKVRDSLNSLYEYVKNHDWEDMSKYTSYRYPTLQLEVDKNYALTPQTDQNKMRYGETFAGVYGRTANQVHHKFAILGTEPVPMPEKEEILNWLLEKHVRPNISFHDIFYEFILQGRLQELGLEEELIDGDGNCFYTAVAFHLSNLMSAHESTAVSVRNKLADIGLRETMNKQVIAGHLRGLVVEEWRQHEDKYTHFLPGNVNYLEEVSKFEAPRFFDSPLGNAMPLAMSNVLGMPLSIVRSEPNIPVLHVSPSASIDSHVEITLVYYPSGRGHYNSTISNAQSTVQEQQERPV